MPEQAKKRALLWCKVTDPAWRPPEAAVAAADDLRVILPESLGPAPDPETRAALAMGCERGAGRALVGMLPHRREARNAMDTRRCQHEPLSVTWEIETVEGEEGKALARRQIQVMLEGVRFCLSEQIANGHAAMSSCSW